MCFFFTWNPTYLCFSLCWILQNHCFGFCNFRRKSPPLPLPIPTTPYSLPAEAPINTRHLLLLVINSNANTSTIVTILTIMIITILTIMISTTSAIWSAWSAGLPRCQDGKSAHWVSNQHQIVGKHLTSTAPLTITIFIIITIASNIISTSSNIGTITKITHSLFYTWGQQPDCSEGRDFLAPCPWSSPSSY